MVRQKRPAVMGQGYEERRKAMSKRSNKKRMTYPRLIPALDGMSSRAAFEFGQLDMVRRIERGLAKGSRKRSVYDEVERALLASFSKTMSQIAQAIEQSFNE